MSQVDSALKFFTMLPGVLAARCMRKLVSTAAYTLSDGHSSSALYTCHKLFSTEEGGPTVAIDRSNLFNAPEHSHAPLPDKEPETELIKQLKALIKVRLWGPDITAFLRQLLRSQLISTST